jgi:hypothetical protein
MATSAGLAWSLANGISQKQYDKNLVDAYKDAVAKGLTDAQIESGMNQYGISAADLARATGVTPESVQARLDAATPTTAAEIAYNKAAMDELAVREAQWAAQQKQNELNWAAKQGQNVTDWAAQQKQNELAWKQDQIQNERNWAAQQKVNADTWAAQQAQKPFANATQGFAQNFANYQSIAPGAQYNPAVTPGGASPYSLIMGQMKPFSNPYANMPVNTPLGGYDPALYERINAANLARDIAAKGGTTLADYYGAGGANSSADAAAATAADSAAAAAASASGTAPGSDGSPGSGAAKGGYVHGGLMFGPNPPGPDDGAVNLDMGEYVIKKSSVDKYGRGLLDMINEGKVPAKKMKSLLG